jgi:UDP-N-acetylenolpyruvoylglucosamine reductase
MLDIPQGASKARDIPSSVRTRVWEHSGVELEWEIKRIGVTPGA